MFEFLYNEESVKKCQMYEKHKLGQFMPSVYKEIVLHIL